MAQFLVSRAESIRAISSAVLMIAALTCDQASAQGRLEANYSISAARITVGNASVTADIGETEYMVSMSGRGSGIMRILASGDGTLQVQGQIRDGYPIPVRYVSTTKADDDILDVKIAFENGNAKDVEASLPPSSDDRVALTELHHNGVMD